MAFSPHPSVVDSARGNEQTRTYGFMLMPITMLHPLTRTTVEVTDEVIDKILEPLRGRPEDRFQVEVRKGVHGLHHEPICDHFQSIYGAELLVEPVIKHSTVDSDQRSPSLKETGQRYTQNDAPTPRPWETDCPSRNLC